MHIFIQYFESPIGLMQIKANKDGLLSLLFLEDREDEEEALENDLTHLAVSQLSEYFDKKRTDFQIPLIMDGSPFQQNVWLKVKEIDYGKTTTYMQIAEGLNNANSVRAVGAANGKNKLAILIPCHRVIAGSGQLTGYAWGLWRKEWLLRHEEAIKQTSLF